MKYKFVPILLPVVLLAACATGGAKTSAAETAAAARNAGCSEGNLKFHVGDSYLKVTPKNKCVDKGMTYTATIVPHGGFDVVSGDVSISGAAAWLNSSNTSNVLEVLIVVPEDAVEGPHKYELEVSGAGSLDPVVRVRTSGG